MKRVANEPAKWLKASWPSLFERLAACQSEEEVEQLCRAEMAAWFARPTMKSEQSLRRPITDSRAEIERQAAAGALNEQQRAWALRYLDFSKEDWKRLNAPIQQRVQEQQENQQFLMQADIDAIVGKLTYLLESTDPFEVAIALMGNTGARPIEALQLMELEQVSPYIVKFYGQAKKKGEEEFPGYEKMTLSPAGAVVRGLARLRSLLKTQQMSAREINRKYSPKLKEAMNRHFSDLIPVPNDHDDLYSYLMRSVYATVATWWYAPPGVSDLAFFTALCGHFELIAGTEEQRRDFAASQHYVRYQILNKRKQVDARRGIRLDEKGVHGLSVFNKTAGAEVAPKKEKDHTIVRFRPEVERRLKLEAARREIPVEKNGYWANDTVVAMLDDPAGEGGKLTPEQLVPADIAVLVREVLGDGDFQAFLETALRKEAKFQKGVEGRYKSQDVTNIPTSQLAGYRTMDAAYERYRRAVAAIAQHNDRAISPNDRWFINTTTVHHLVGGKFAIITGYLDSRKEEIQALNDKHGLTPRANWKAAKINEEAAGPAQVIVPE